jgi:xylulokinase
MIIGLDLGTTALKVAIFDGEGTLLGVSTQEYPLITEKAAWVEADPEIYWDSLKAGLADLKTQVRFLPEQVRSLAMSAQGETLFFVDANGKALRNAIVWMDNRAHAEAEALRARFSDKTCYEVTGQVSFEPCWPASKVLWVKNNESELFQKTDKILLIEDYFIYRMTGELVSEGSLLCSTTYWNIMTKQYWPEMLEYIGITEANLPRIVESGEPIAGLKPEIAKELGLSCETMICSGALDQAAGAIGAGNIREGMFSENIGAALAICVPVNRPVFDSNRCMPLHYFPIPGMYMLHTFTTGGMTMKWFRDNFCDDEITLGRLTDEDPYAIMDKEALTVAAGSEGLVMLPHLSGSLAPDVNSKAKGVYFGITLQHRKSHFIRAIMESVGYTLNRNLEAISDMGIEVKEIRSLGGGAKSSVWNQIKADITGRKMVTTHAKEAACLGAAILAGKAVGIFNSVEDAVSSMAKINKEFTPDPINREVYDKGFAAYKKLFQDMKELFDSTFEKE